VSTDDQLRTLLTSAQDSLAKMAALLTSSTPAGILTVRATAVTADSVTVTWDTTLTPSAWTVGRDGQDVNGTGPWQTQVTGRGTMTFSSLRPATKYTFFVAPAGGDSVTVSATTSADTSTGGTAGGGSGATAAGRLGWGDPDPISDDFASGKIDAAKWLLPGNVGQGWDGHNGNGRRMPESWSCAATATATPAGSARTGSSPTGAGRSAPAP
jgi:hypothetical protein